MLRARTRGTGSFFIIILIGHRSVLKCGTLLCLFSARMLAITGAEDLVRLGKKEQIGSGKETGREESDDAGSRLLP